MATWKYFLRVVLLFTTITVNNCSYDLDCLSSGQYQTRDCVPAGPPICKVKDPVLICADATINMSQNCNEDDFKIILGKSESLKSMQKVACSNNDILQAFKNESTNCWQGASDCAIKYLAPALQTGRVKNPDSELCKNVTSQMENCKKVEGCTQKVNEKIIKELLADVKCCYGGYNMIATWTMLFALLIAIITK